MAESEEPTAPESWCAAVLELPTDASADQTLGTLTGDQRLALVSLAIHRQRAPSGNRSTLLAHSDKLLDRCERLGFDHSTCERLRRSIQDADPNDARLLVRILRNLLRGSPFLLLTRRSLTAPPLRLPADFIAVTKEMFGVTVEVLTNIDDVFSRPVRRPPPRGLMNSTDRELFNLLTCPDGELEQRWSQWLETADIDDRQGFVAVGPLLHERLHRIGVENGETNRLAGIRRLAWSSNALKKVDSIEIIRRLRAVGIDPVFTGGILAALEAEQDNSVRPIRLLAILVDVNEAPTALKELESLYGSIPDWVGPPSLAWATRSNLRVGRDLNHSLDIRWRWLPERGASLVPLDDVGTTSFDLDGTMVRGLSPSARLVELCSRSVAIKPGSTLDVFVQAYELIVRHHAEISWEWVQSALERLELVPHAQLLLDTLPDRIRTLVPLTL